MAQRFDTIILGAGLTGLTLAHRLQRAGKNVRLLEKATRPGGVIRSERRDGFLCEAGPNSLLIKDARVARYLDELGLRDELIAARPEAAKRFLVRGGKLRTLPASPFSAVATPLYSWPAKLRFLREPWQPVTKEADTSVAEFVERRLGREFLDYGIAPLVSGIFAGDPARLSMRHAFPGVWDLEARGGSLIRGALALRKERKAKGEKAFRSQLVSFHDGLESISRAQALALGEALVTGVEVERVQAPEGARPWSVAWQASDGPQRAEADQLIVTTPVHAWDKIGFPVELAAALAGLPAVEHPPVSTLVLGFRREQVQHALDGFGVLIPAVENEPLLGSIFSSSLFPGRAPEGHVALMNFLGGATQPDNGRLETGDAVSSTLGVLRRLFGVSGEPVFVHHTRWPHAIPQYHVGYERFVEGLAAVESRFPGLRLRGNFRGGPGLNDVILNALGD